MKPNPESALDAETVRLILVERLRNTRRKVSRELIQHRVWTIIGALLAATSFWWLINDGGAAWWFPFILNTLVSGMSAWMWTTCLELRDDIDALMEEMTDEG